MTSFLPADILIPENIDMTKWSTVACDQYTSQPEYWEETKKIVGNAPSALNVIFPEIYLSDKPEERINAINKKMCEYESIFKKYESSFVFVKRTLSNGKVRKGLIGAVDLEAYSYEKGASSDVRATEGTVFERIPPRVKIRENAPLEFPHIMLLADDPGKTVIEPLEAICTEKLYDFELMQNGGKIEGYKVPDDCTADVVRSLEALSDKAGFEKKYSAYGRPVMTFAVGDGNHSLATAKTCWENIKRGLSEEEKKTHPARFALAELVNLCDDSLEFEPIHRLLFDVDPEKVFAEISKYYPETSEENNGGKRIECVYAGKTKTLYVKDEKNTLTVGTLQSFIDRYTEKYGGKVDYIHGADVTTSLAQKDGRIGFLLPAMQKNELFKSVIFDGALPRKTFSMGEACDKRYYLEGKKIR